MKKIVFLAVCLCSGLALFAADQEVGRIESISGKVLIWSIKFFDKMLSTAVMLHRVGTSLLLSLIPKEPTLKAR